MSPRALPAILALALLAVLPPLAATAEPACTICYRDVPFEDVYRGESRPFCWFRANTGPRFDVIEDQAAFEAFVNLFVPHGEAGAVDWETELVVAFVAPPHARGFWISRIEVNDQPYWLPTKVHLGASPAASGEADGGAEACAGVETTFVHVVRMERVESLFLLQHGPAVLGADSTHDVGQTGP